MHWPFRSDKKSFFFLNITQFLGALNDNVFKLLVIYLLINVKGAEHSSEILALAGAVFVIPFLLFSSAAGVLADRLSKTKIIVLTKGMEVITMLFGVITVSTEWAFGSYFALFLMATQSALFGPSKYGIIPELVDSKEISKANGSLTSFTYLSIILGTFLASWIADVTNKNFFVESLFCLFIAIIGLLTSFCIRKTEPQLSKKKIHPVFFYEIYQTVKNSWAIPQLMAAIFGSSFFLFVGSFTQLNIIPFGMQSLGLSEIGGGYLFLATAIGIAIGSKIAGKYSKEKVEPGLAIFFGFGIVFFFLTLYFFSFSLTLTILSLIFVGICGGTFLIPFDSFIQTYSPDKTRGQVIAAANFFSFFGVLVSAVILYLFGDVWKLKASTGFALMGILTLIANFFLMGRFSKAFFTFLAEKIFHRLGSLEIEKIEPKRSKLLVLQASSLLPLLFFFSKQLPIQILFPSRYRPRFPWINGWIENLWILPSEPELLKEKIEKINEEKKIIILFFHKKKDDEKLLKKYELFFSGLEWEVSKLHLSEKKSSSRYFLFRFDRKDYTAKFL